VLSADWEVKYSVLPKLSHDEKVGNYFFCVKDDACHVTVVFGNQLRPDEHGTLNVDQVDASAQAETHRLRIEELMLIRNVYQQVTCPIEVNMLNERPQLLNKEDLLRQGIVPKWRVSISVTTAWRTIVVGDSITESQDYWQKASQGKMSSHAADVLRIEKWLQSSEDDDAYGTSFVHLWTAFNALWSCVCGTIPCGENCDHCRGELHVMEHSIHQLLRASSSDVERAVVGDLRAISQEEWIHDRGKNEHFGAQLRDILRLPEGDPFQRLLVGLECAYVFRCELFHEAPDPDYVARWSPVFSHLLRQVTATCLFSLTRL
jgi:hypothetical protein